MLAASPPGGQPLHLGQGAGGGRGLRGLAGGQEPVHGPGAPAAQRELLPASAATRRYGEPAYYKDLSFDNDLNPQCGSQRGHRPGDPLHHQGPHRRQRVARLSGDGPGADAGRVAAGAGPRLPRRVQDARQRPGSRASWRSCSRTSAASIPASEVDRKWRMDLLDAFSYMRNVDRRGFQAKEAVLNGLLSRYPLTEDGYVAAAAALFWDNGQSLTSLFVRDRQLPQADHPGRPRPGHLHATGPACASCWTASGRRSTSGRTRRSGTASPGATSTSMPKDKYFVLDYRPGTRHGHRGTGDDPGRHAGAGHPRAAPPPERRLAQGDRADGLPRHARACGPSARASSRASATEADTLEEQMEIVKRGKVSYLFERYTDELQIQTLLLLLARRQPRSQGPDEVPRREVGQGPLRRKGLAAQGAATRSRPCSSA